MESSFQFRAEATNAFNMVSLANPTANLSSGNNGKITGARAPNASSSWEAG